MARPGPARNPFWDSVMDSELPAEVAERGRRVLRSELRETYGGDTAETVARRARAAQSIARTRITRRRSR